MKGNLLVATILLVTLIPLILVTQTLATSAAADGKEVFVAAKCSMCHAVSSAGIEAKMKGSSAGPDLKGISAERSAEWIAAYLKKEEKIDGKDHKAAFKGTDEEMKAVIDWLMEQK